jgi:hypothetical protein
MYFKALLIMSFPFFFNWYSNFKITFFFPFYLIFFYFLIFTPISIFIKLIYGVEKDSYELTLNPILYRENTLTQRRRKILFVFESVLHPYILSILMFYLTNYHLVGSYDSNGIPSSLEIMYLVIFVLTLMIFHSNVTYFVLTFMVDWRAI